MHSAYVSSMCQDQCVINMICIFIVRSAPVFLSFWVDSGLLILSSFEQLAHGKPDHTSWLARPQLDFTTTCSGVSAWTVLKLLRPPNSIISKLLKIFYPEQQGKRQSRAFQALTHQRIQQRSKPTSLWVQGLQLKEMWTCRTCTQFAQSILICVIMLPYSVPSNFAKLGIRVKPFWY